MLLDIGWPELMLIGVIATTFFTLMIPLVQTSEQLIIVRLLTGIGAGGAVSAAFPIAAELMPAQHRRTYGAIYEMSLAASFTVVPFIGGLLAGNQYAFRFLALPGGLAITVVPVLILVAIAIPSFKLMYYMDRVPDAAMTINVTGHQWYWSYAYPKEKIAFDSNIVPEDKLKPGQPRLLTVDNPLVVPANTNVRVLVTSTDVIHSWFMPSFGVQEYAVIGRHNESWFNVEKPGTYYGECNQICGVNHSRMPIEIVAMSKPDYEKWLVDAKKKFAAAPQEPAPALVAAAGGSRAAGY